MISVNYLTLKATFLTLFLFLPSSKSQWIISLQRKRTNKEEEKKETIKQPEANNKIILVRPYQSLKKINRLNYSIKKPKVAGLIKKNKTQPYAAYKGLTSALRAYIGSKWRSEKEVNMEMNAQKTPGVVILLSHIIDFKSITIDKEGHYIMIKGSEY